MALTIYHNPRCSKSRQTLALIKDAGIEPEIVLYLEQALTQHDLETLLQKLGFESAKQLMRRGEAAYKEMGLKNVTDEKTLTQAMLTEPKLIERPIVTKGNRAILGRPPENVLQLLG